VIAAAPATIRLEDERLLLGGGRFHDDVVRAGQLWMQVVRSPVAHARLLGIDTSDAELAPRVVDVITAADLPAEFRVPVRQATPGVDFDPYLQAPLARDYVRYVGDPVAAVLAEDPVAAQDAAELVELELEELAPALDARAASSLRPPAFGGRPAEVAVVELGYGDVDGAFASAAHVVSASLRVGRHSGTPLEPRGLVAEIDEHTGRMTIWGATKVPYWNRRVVAELLGMPAEQIHMLETDAGGSFGIRGELYPEDLLVPFCCLRSRRPVKWSEDRRENLVAANHAREQEHRIELAFDADLTLVGLRDDVWLDTGAYIRTHGAVVAVLTASMMPGSYRLPATRTSVHIVATNKTPIGTYRAPGRFQSTFAREHVLDVAATQLGVDPLELRRRNLLDASELPHVRPIDVFGAPMVLDGGDHLGQFDKSIELVGYERWREEARSARRAGRRVGAGCAVILEKAGVGAEHAIVEVDEDGIVHVAMGGANLGQGIETVMAQIAADVFDVAPHAVAVILSDTDVLDDGGGSFASRSTVVGGSAVRIAAEQVLDEARALASRMLDVASEDLVVRDGGFVADGAPDVRVDLADVARRASGGDAWSRLVARSTFAVDGMTYPYGVHFAQVEIDEETGRVTLLRYAITYEIGRAVNRKLVEGQLVGGAAQGIGGALLEEFTYDERGMPLAVTLADYQWPTAADVPDIEVHLLEDAPAPGNPLGVRGAGEGGTAGPGGAIANAVRDALALAGDVGALPLRPERVMALIRERDAAAGRAR
jgi:carbon-monoxide dehydrogenase large subunit